MCFCGCTVLFKQPSSSVACSGVYALWQNKTAEEVEFNVTCTVSKAQSYILAKNPSLGGSIFTFFNSADNTKVWLAVGSTRSGLSPGLLCVLVALVQERKQQQPFWHPQVFLTTGVGTATLMGKQRQAQLDFLMRDQKPSAPINTGFSAVLATESPPCACYFVSSISRTFEVGAFPSAGRYCL